MRCFLASKGQPPKLAHAPLVQLDTSSKYYKTMIDGMVLNFKKAVAKASDKMYSMSNVTTIKPITVASTGTTGQQQRVSIQDLQIEGLSHPKVNNVYVNKKNMKLHVVFGYKSIRVSGRCSSSAQKQTGSQSGNKLLLEATNWNSSWSASLMPMIGREHFDMNRVHTTHSQQRLSLNLKECPQALHDKLRTALLDRVQQSIENRLVEIMETVMMQADNTSEDFTSLTTDSPTASAPTQIGSQKALKRTKRQTPCQQGEELDDYVDQLFRFGTRIVRAMEPVTLPNATVELPDYNLKIFLYEGKGTRAYKFRRAKSAWVFCSNETISLGLTIEVEELRVAYKYRVISGTRLLFDGDLEAKLSPKVQAQFSQAVQEEDSEEPVQQRVDRIRVFRLGKVHVVIRGLGNLTQSLSMLINSYLNDNQEELQPTFRMVEGDAVRLINRMLANVNVPLLSVV